MDRKENDKKEMVDKKEIVVRVLVFSIVYVLITVVLVSYFGQKWLLIPVFIVIVVWGIYVYRMNVKVLGMPVQSMELEGLEGRALTDVQEEGKVKVRAEIWNARSVQYIKKGTKVKVITRDGIVLEVEPVED